MRIVWDEPKRRANLDKHGLDFADLSETFFDDALVIPSHNASKRWVAIGVNIRGVIVVVFARLGREGISIVSMRPAAREPERKEILCRTLRKSVGTAKRICAMSAIVRN